MRKAFTISNLDKKKEDDVMKEVLSFFDSVAQKNVMLTFYSAGGQENISREEYFHKPLNVIREDVIKNIKESLPNNLQNKIEISEEDYSLLLHLYTGCESGVIHMEFVSCDKYDAASAEIKSADLPEKIKSHYLDFLEREADYSHCSLESIQLYFEDQLYIMLHNAVDNFCHNEVKEQQPLKAQNALEKIMEEIQKPDNLPEDAVFTSEVIRDLVSAEYKSEDWIIIKMADTGKVLHEIKREEVSYYMITHIE